MPLVKEYSMLIKYGGVHSEFKNNTSRSDCLAKVAPPIASHPVGRHRSRHFHLYSDFARGRTERREEVCASTFLSNFRFLVFGLISTVIVARMSHRKWRETKKQLI